jgi:hypothetical protein
MAVHTVTLNLSETIYQRLRRRSQQSQRPLEDELLDLLAGQASLPELSGNMPPAYIEIIEFLGRGATAQEIANFCLSEAAQARAQTLLAQHKAGMLTPPEEHELDLYIELENFMALLKNQARQQLTSPK